MHFSQEQIDELKKIAPNLSIAQEGDYFYLLIEKLQMPDNCIPSEVDALLCPTTHTGYNSRLLLSEKLTGVNPSLNWNGKFRVLERNWFAISWNLQPNQNLAEILMLHLKPFRK